MTTVIRPFLSAVGWHGKPTLSARTTPTGPGPRPAYLAVRSSTTFIMGSVCTAIFTDLFLYGIIVPVMPYSLTGRCGIAADDVQRWNAILFACYGLSMFAFSPIAGLYADHTSSRRAPLLLGLVALGGATVMLCVGRTIAVLVVGRLLQGASAAVVWSAGLALLVDTMGRSIGVAMGYVGIALSMALLLAPLVGGAVYAGAGYYAVFYVAFGLISVDIAMRVLLIEKKVARRWVKEEEAAAVTDVEMEAAGAVTVARSEPAESDPPTPLPVVRAESSAAAAAAPPTAAVTAATTTTTTTAATPGTFRRSWILLCCGRGRLLAALFCCVVQGSLLTAFDTVLPLFVSGTFGWGSTASGLLFFTLYLPSCLLSPPVGMVADRFGAKWLSLSGFVACLPLLVCLRFVDHNSTAQKVLLGVLLSVLGVALTLANVPLMAEIGFTIEAEEAAEPGLWGEKGVYGLGYGLYTMSFSIGSSGGSLVAGYLQSIYGWATMNWCLSVWCGMGLLVVLLWVGEFRVGPPRDQGQPEEGQQGQPSQQLLLGEERPPLVQGSEMVEGPQGQQRRNEDGTPA